VHYEAQVTHNKLTSRRQIAFVVQSVGKGALFFWGENRELADGSQVGVEISSRRHTRQFHYICRHGFSPRWVSFRFISLVDTF
jgi:hypothetical protein